MTTQFTFRRARADVSIATIESTLNDILSQLAATSDDVPDRIDVEETDQGFDPLTATIVVTVVGNLASRAIEHLWADEIWPRLQDKLGDDALVPKEESEEAK